MKILAIETSSIACSLALQIDDAIFTHHEIAPLQQAQIILPSINALLQSNHVKLEELDAIAFGQGPGSFTGVRIATSVAQGLGLGAAIPLVPISSLAALAQTAYNDLGWEGLLVAVDARMNEIYCASYHINEGLAKLEGEESICSPAKFPFTHSKDGYGVGDAWDIYKNHLPDLVHINAKLIPSALGVLALAKAKYEQGGGIAATEAQPVYLREKVTS